MKVGEKIKDTRKIRGWSAEQLAEKVGLSPATIYRYENGSVDVPIAKIAKFAEVLNVEEKELMGFEEKKEAENEEADQNAAKFFFDSGWDKGYDKGWDEGYAECFGDFQEISGLDPKKKMNHKKKKCSPAHSGSCETVEITRVEYYFKATNKVLKTLGGNERTDKEGKNYCRYFLCSECPKHGLEDCIEKLDEYMRETIEVSEADIL